MLYERKIILRNGKEAKIIKQLTNDSYIAFYKGIEGESLFIITNEQISKKSSLPYIFTDIDDKPKKRRKK